jgi:hypothetical protein
LSNQPCWCILLYYFTSYRIQVLANSTIATVLVVILALMTGGQDQCLDSNDSKLITGIIGGIIGHYCCCNGDTWSSEIGVLSNEQPRLITTLKVSVLFHATRYTVLRTNVVHVLSSVMIVYVVHARLQNLAVFPNLSNLLCMSCALNLTGQSHHI